MENHGSSYRPDIDGLRALAVWLVILFHAFPGAVSGGFVGVDVFFVISGFLITNILVRDLETERFSIKRFYARRIRRIFPALLTILVATYAIGWFVLFDYEMKYISAHLAAGIGFLSNYSLWRESGYFDVEAELKPLLHLWSLAIEEQFYIVWPLLLLGAWAIFRRKYRAVFGFVALLAGLSFAANIYFLARDPAGAFFFPFTRAWELLTGALLALHRGSKISDVERRPAVLTRAAAFFGLALIVGSAFLLTKGPHFPGWFALFPVFGTILLIGTRETWFHDLLSRRALVWFGLISYPLYLWHWPLFAYVRIASGHQPVIPVVFVVAIMLSVLLAWLTYRFIETPLRFPRTHEAAKFVSLLVAAGLIVGVAAVTLKQKGFPNRTINQQVKRYDGAIDWIWVRSDGCEEIYGSEAEPPFCAANHSEPRVFFLGDSHANQLFGGVVDMVPAISAGNGVPIDVPVLTDQNPQNNVRSLDKSKAFLEKNRGRIKVVVIAAQWDALTNGTLVRPGNGTLTLAPERDEERGKSRIEIIESSLSRTVEFIEKLGMTAVISLDAPEISFEPRNCFRRLFADDNACVDSVERKAVLERQALSRAMFARIQSRHPKLAVFDPLPVMCDEKKCPYFAADGSPLYRDGSHIGIATSRRIAESFVPGLKKLIGN